MAATADDAMVARLKAQIDDAKGYIGAALRRGEGLQIVLHFDASGRVNPSKFTITARPVQAETSPLRRLN